MIRFVTLAILASCMPAMAEDDVEVSAFQITFCRGRLSKEIESQSAVGQKNDNSKRDEIVVGEMLEYAINIREKNGDVSYKHVMPRIHACGRVEVYVGLPTTNEERKVTSPHRAFVTAKIISEKEGVAEVCCTIGQKLDFKNENGSTTWTEKKLTSNRTIRFGETIVMDLPSSNPESPAYECSIKISRDRKDGASFVFGI